MQTITKNYHVYQFSELSEDAKEKAILELIDINVDHEWWQWTYEDAERVGLSISEFDIDRASYVRGSLSMSMADSIAALLKEHGESTDTYKLAKDYQQQIIGLGRNYKLRGINRQAREDYEDAIYQLQDDFEKALCEEYLIILRHEYEYLTSNEAIMETIESNAYTFLEDGEMFNG